MDMKFKRLCCVCADTDNLKRYGSQGILLCKQHSKGLTEHANGSGDLGYFGQGTGGGYRVIKSTRGMG